MGVKLNNPGGSGASTDTLDDVCQRGSTTSVAITGARFITSDGVYDTGTGQILKTEGGPGVLDNGNNRALYASTSEHSLYGNNGTTKILDFTTDADFQAINIKTTGDISGGTFSVGATPGIDATVTYVDTLLGATTLTFTKGVLTAQVY